MVFSSIAFLYYFLPVFLIIYFIVPDKFKNIILLLFSLAFYAYGEPVYIIIVMISVLSSFINGLLIEKYFESKIKRLFLIIDICVSLGFLAYFKYTDFFIANINNLFNSNLSLLHIALPVGISFYTFQTISYTIDVYKGEVKAQRNFIKLATFVSKFPQKVAGPVVRYSEVEKELTKRTHSFENFSLGMRRFIIGLAKKVILANNFGLLYDIFLGVGDRSVAFYWLAGLAFMLQIYFDFSGYSDMAIGLARMLGFKFAENFNYPYIAKSITDFWRRWHISLSSWFKDYIYIPLGGSRVSKIKALRNIMIVWLITGFWHGAAWNFVFWGLYFGVLLIIEKLWVGKILEKLPNLFRYAYTLFIVYISWIIFNSHTPLADLQALFGMTDIPMTNNVTIYYFRSYLILFLVGIIGATPILRDWAINLKTNEKSSKMMNLVEPIFLVVLLMISTAYLVDGSFNPFIYFRF